MAILNRILSVLILITGVAALVFGFLLFGKRTELRERGNKMAVGVANVAQALDANSGTQVAKEVSSEDEGAGGNLGVAQFAKLDGRLKQAQDQANQIRDQRDRLGESLSKISKDFGIENMTPELFQIVESHQQAIADLGAKLEASRLRKEALADRLEEVAATVGVPIDSRALRNVGDPAAFKTAADGIMEKVKTNGASRERMSQALRRIGNKLEDKTQTDISALKDAPDDVVAATLNVLDNMNEQVAGHDKIKVERDQLKVNLDEQVKKAEECFAQVNILENQLADANAELEKLRGGGTTPVPTNGEPVLPGPGAKDFDGSVVKVNYKFNYVIITLGQKDGLLNNLTMTVHRDREFICKIQVSKVYESYAVAEILPDLKQGDVIEGDRVFYYN